MPITVNAAELELLLSEVANFTTLTNANRWRHEVEAQDQRRMQLAEENMKLMADLSTAKTKIADQQAAVEQAYRDAQGHNHCWRNWDRLWEAFGLKAKPLGLPPRDEAEAGCKAFWDELYGCPHRWPDFIKIGDE